MMELSQSLSVWGLFVTSFLAATLLPLPGGSETILIALIMNQPEDRWMFFTVATLGNSLGGISSWLAGRVIAWRFPARELTNIQQQRGLALLKRWGSPLLIFSWIPIIGDPLCLVAGWLKIPLLSAALFITLGKAARYLFILLFV